jgi:DNA ligase D-like protein (predicted polymerase)/DNA ligase D-like protein (predicted 3'-phosphoesterase)
MGQEAYRRKRDFSATPEPPPASETLQAGRFAGSSFVVHRHEARRLHYDLRIRAGDALACWAVPKGFSYDPADKRLAVRTEDHPLEYESFHGVIPRGQYGAGTMQIWDSGDYRLVKGLDILEALKQGELKLELKGRRLRGEWHLVRTRGEEGKEWLLFKAKDRYAGFGSDLFGAADMGRARRKPPPPRPGLMEPSPGHALFSDPDWMFETSFTGRRVAISVSETQVNIRSTKTDLAPLLPAIVHDLGALRVQRAILDGVLVALDAKGVPSERTLEERLEAGGSGVVLYVFDVLYVEEWDVRPLPLRERKALLLALLPERNRVLRVDPVSGRGEALAEAASRAGLAEIVAKRSESPYRAGPSDDWRLIDVRRAAGARSAGRKRATAIARVTNPRKVYWPEQGYTKADLVAFYDGVADVLLPYLRERPLHLYRWPDGVRGKSFYQKQLPAGLPGWVETANVAPAGEKPTSYIVCGDRRTLLTLINLGSIDLHPWLSRRGSLDSPDWAVLDLDPKDAPFASVVKIARETGKLLRGLGLEPYLKTSGSTGLHVFIPLAPGYTYDQSRMFSEAVARLLVRDHGDIATVERVVGRRAGKVYIDFLQNRREQTIVPPYVVRPVEAATVSMPLAWDELEGDLSLRDYTLASACARIQKVGDLFSAALRRPQDLSPAIEALGRYLNPAGPRRKAPATA